MLTSCAMRLNHSRLALDAAITKSQNSKKDTGALEEEVSIARIRLWVGAIYLKPHRLMRE